ncbi:MAG: Uma2 family endonuclease [Cyanobacteria bacterium P01_G01_bin.39]
MTAIDIATFTEQISDRQLEQLCADNPEARFETTPAGKLIIMSPTGSLTGEKNSDLNYQLQVWNRQGKLGKVFDSSTGFKLSNGATRSPDASWIEIDRWQAIPKAQQRKFAPVDPDFVIELMSPTDDLTELQQKMVEYIDCGVRLSWLICPDEKQVEIYRQGQEKEVLINPSSLSGENILPGLIVDLTDIFDD